MSWLYSQALVEEYLGDTCLDGEPSAPLSGSHTQQAYCAPDKMTAFSRPSRSGMMYKPLTENRGEELLTLYLAAFRARTSASRGGGQESTASGLECGDTWRGSLARFDPATSSWRTAQRSLLGDSDESLVIWPRSGMTAGGQCWELPKLERRTSGTGSGLWRTPSASVVEAKSTVVKLTGRTPQDPQVGLADQVMAAERGMWPTPTTKDNPQIKGEGKAAAHPKRGTTLGGAVRLWPTPIASDSRGSSGKPAPGKQMQLVDAVRFATPLSRDWRSGKTSQATAEKNSRPLSEQIGGSLNPTWVEWLMGWPLGWTDLKPLETGKSPCVQQQHGEF